MQEHQLEAVQTQVGIQRLVIEDLEHKLSDALELVGKLEVRVQAFGYLAAAKQRFIILQAQLQQERLKNASSPHPTEQLSNSESISRVIQNGSLLQDAPGTRLNEALSIIKALRESIRT